MENSIILNCRHCSKRNRISLDKALYNTSSSVCGVCKKNIFLELDEKIDLFDVKNYIHPLDKATLKKLRAIPALTSVLKLIVSSTNEKFFKILNYQNNIKVSDKQFPEIYNLYKKMINVFSLENKEPELFVYNDEEINAYTYGVDKHFIAISSGAISKLNDNQIMVILAHELAHIVLEHVLYKMATRVLINISSALTAKTLGLSDLLLKPMINASLAWDRASELSADRISLCAVKNLYEANMTILKSTAYISKYDDSKYNYEAFLEQAKEAREIEDESIIVKIYNMFQNLNFSLFPVWRTGELNEWAQNGNYIKLISKNLNESKEISTNTVECSSCKEKYSPVLNVCPYCGHSDKEEDSSFFEKLKGFFK